MARKIRDLFNLLSEKGYRNILKVVPSHIPKAIGKTDFTYITLCGAAHVPMLRESILSLLNSWSNIPSFIIYADGSITTDQLKENFKWLGSRLTVLDWTACLSDFDPITEKYIIDFARKHVMGKKFAVILSNGRKRPSFWCDADVLWYSDFHIEPFSKNSFQIIASSDYQPSYSKNLVSIYPKLLNSPFICAGIVFINGDMLSNADLTEMLKVALDAPDHFSEQTMVARTVIESNGQLWDPEIIACYESDKYSLFPTYINKNWTARHYVSPVRHLFWRDAFFRRFINGSKRKVKYSLTVN